MSRLLNIGFGNVVNTDKIVCIISPDSAPAKRLVQNGKNDGSVIDASSGRRTKSVIITDTGVIILSALATDTLAGRFNDDVMENRGDKL
ncbi:hypothetical protein SAMN05216249_102170 [Acetitomaculum ruminis DSM 5522]|uniref:Putative regulatory protein SAMN05216249_102170 n=1 Tax=Acetitomaculum ruminis DSM 5522 TaxID=1120918 RepID=A0A1I0VTJ8_9FIRM|nr:DUF370 domain-containing protein [Acetitomaculum ruminis]SFA79283.1 hypothetical protein SAMN05216249_102170 [Acetitomaculum ruminis DSM 5522]